jgi:serine/threonine protein kinase
MSNTIYSKTPIISPEVLIDCVNENPTCADHILYNAQEFVYCSLVYSPETMLYKKQNGVVTLDFSNDLLSANKTSLKNSPFDYKKLEQFMALRKLLNVLVARYNHNDSEVELIQHETNATVLLLKHCVIKFYDCDLYNTLRVFFSFPHKNIESVLYHELTPFFGFTVTKKYIPVDKMIEQKKITPGIADMIHDHTFKALEYMHSINFTHGDPNLNNTGYDPDTKCFVLFDFDRSRLIKTDRDIDEDYRRMNKSFKYKFPGQFVV